jgi:hypothetical protein
MSTSPSANPDSGHAQPTVPRDKVLDGSEQLRTDSPSSAADVNTPDEEYTDEGKPLVTGSREAKALHNRQPGKGQLGVGTAGDAARPTKPGIHNKPVPPRGHL